MKNFYSFVYVYQMSTINLLIEFPTLTQWVRVYTQIPIMGQVRGILNLNEAQKITLIYRGHIPMTDVDTTQSLKLSDGDVLDGLYEINISDAGHIAVHIASEGYNPHKFTYTTSGMAYAVLR